MHMKTSFHNHVLFTISALYVISLDTTSSVVSLVQGHTHYCPPKVRLCFGSRRLLLIFIVHNILGHILRWPTGANEQ